MTVSVDSSNGSQPSLTMTKHHGLGNDFLVAINPARPSSDDEVRLWCDRHVGIGADGVIIGTGPNSDGRWHMYLRNADGSRAAISGNGIRCLGQAIAHSEGLDPSAANTIEVNTDAGLRTLDIYPSNDPHLITVRVAMGELDAGPELSDAWADAGVSIKDQISADIGNPHLVGFVDGVGAYDISVIGPKIEAGYPQGCNVHLAEVVDESTIKIVIWERGAGVTQACGSGACAVAWAGNQLGYVDRSVTVDMPGGSARIELTDDGALLTGPSCYVAKVIF